MEFKEFKQQMIDKLRGYQKAALKGECPPIEAVVDELLTDVRLFMAENPNE